MIEDATGGSLPVAAGLRGYDHRLREKNLLEKKLSTEFHQLIGFFFFFFSLLRPKATCGSFGDGFIRRRIVSRVFNAVWTHAILCVASI